MPFDGRYWTRSQQKFMVKGMFVAFAFAFAGFVIFRSQIMLEFGLIAFIVDAVWELRGTKKGWWKYSESYIYDLGGRVPIEIPLSIAFGSMFLVSLAILLIGLF